MEPLKWSNAQVNPNDLQLLQSEVQHDSDFDPLRLRRSMVDQVHQGQAELLAKQCSLAKIIWVKTLGTNIEPPWELWGRILQWLGPSSNHVPWRIFWLPAPVQRVLPDKGKEVGPRHVNGGYCYPCKPDCIIIYRLEEATRVFVHELLHAACLDPYGHSLPYREANIETWAELFLIAICSKGKESKAKELWSEQSQWIANQNYVLKKYYHVYNPSHYSWRYTVGREDILRELHITLPKGHVPNNHSCRLTSPLLCL